MRGGLAVALLLVPALGWSQEPMQRSLNEAAASLPAAALEGSALSLRHIGVVGDGPEPVDIAVGNTVPIDLPAPVSNIVIARPDVADVVVHGPRRAYLMGLEPGVTDVFFTDAQGTVIHSARVLVSPNLDAATEVLRRLLPQARFDLRAVGDGVLLSGFVRSAQEAADAQKLLERFLGDDDGKRVINALNIEGEQQVLLQVTIAEVQRNTLRRLGVNTEIGSRSTEHSILNADEWRLGAGETMMRNNVMPNLLGDVIGNNVLGLINPGAWTGIDRIHYSTLERQGLIKVLAEPTLTAISGETANFLAGGEYPTPAGLDQNGNLIIEFREFGVSLSFTPVVLAEDRLSLRIATEVSRIADEFNIPIAAAGGTIRVQGLSVRRAQSTVMLPSGGSLMIAGLLQNDEFNSFEGVPGLMDLPIIGPLFRSHNFQTNRSELVVMVRAFKVRPIETEQRLSLPTDGFVPASDFDIYMLGRLHARYGGSAEDTADGTPETGRVLINQGEFPPVPAGPLGYIMQ